MFHTVKRVISWCGSFKKQLYIGFLFSFFSTWFAAMPIMVAAYAIGKLIEAAKGGEAFDGKWVMHSFWLILLLVFLRFLFDYLRARFQETISYELVARDRLAVGEALKRVSLGYFQKQNTGNILNSITTGLHTLESMGIRMIDTFVGGYLNFLCLFLCLCVMQFRIAMITLAGVAVSFFFLMMISKYSSKNAKVVAKTNRDLTSATIEYTRGLSVVKSFGQEGASVAAMQKACQDNCNINLKIEAGYIPSNCMHLLALKIASVAIVFAAFYMGLHGQMEFPMVLIFAFFSFVIFAGIEPISDSAHVLAVIDDALDQLEALKTSNVLDENGREIALNNYDIELSHVDFGYDKRQVLKDISFRIPEGTSTAIVGPSGSGKSTICNLIARFYDPDHGNIFIGGHNVKEFTCDSLLKNFSMVFQNVYLFHDSIYQNILFGNPSATREEVIAAAKAARCHEFIMKLPEGYDTVIGEGGDTLSGGQKQRISIARAMLKDAPVIILDEATASIDPENEQSIQQAISALTKNKTIITIAHRLATIQNADQILVISDGKIAEQGTHEELLKKNGVYKDFIKIREKAEGWKIEEK